jgi:hypothetical protein
MSLARATLTCVLAALAPSLVVAEGPEWTVLSGSLSGENWRTPTGAWFQAGDARVAPDNPKRLVGEPGSGVIINGPTGRTSNLVSKAEYGDLEFHCEFLVPGGSNSGVKFEGLYEIQIADSHGIAQPKAQHCGGVYPRAELLPTYHYLDEGYPPRVNAARPAGEWQVLDAVFLAPRFDDQGKKTANARLVKVVLNGQIIHEDLELKTPTGHAWVRPEVPRGPILLQADHGPVAFRDVRVRPLARP